METVAERLRTSLRAAFPPPAAIEITTGTWNDEPSYTVSVVTDEFRGLDDLERQERVWIPIREALSPRERLSLALVLTDTQDEGDFAVVEAASRDDGHRRSNRLDAAPIASLPKKLSSILSAEFPPPAGVEVVEYPREEGEPDYQVFIVSDDFEGIDHFERQARAWKPLKGVLTPEEQSRIMIVVAATKAEEEFAIMCAESRSRNLAGRL